MIDIIVIGGGAAGMTAALYAKRSGKTVKIFEKESFGGQIASSPKVENFPSIKEISGLELSNNMFEQIMDLGVEFECEDVLEIKQENDCFIVTTDYNTYLAKAVIIAVGVIPCFAADGSCTCGQTPIVYVAALGSGSVYLDEGTENQRTLFRPDIGDILGEFTPLLPAVTELLNTKNYDAFSPLNNFKTSRERIKMNKR